MPRDTDENVEDCVGTREPLVVISGFETFVAGVTYNQDKEPNTVIGDKQKGLPPLFFGIGLMSYRKPYQVTIGGNTLPDYLFDGIFRGAGVAFASELGGGMDNYFASIDVQTGLGEVSLLDDLTLNELAPQDWLIGYMQGTATIGYRLPLIRAAPTLTFVPQLSMGGATFFFFSTEPNEDQGNIDSPGVNWDLLWQVRGSLVLPL